MTCLNFAGTGSRLYVAFAMTWYLAFTTSGRTANSYIGQSDSNISSIKKTLEKMRTLKNRWHNQVTGEKVLRLCYDFWTIVKIIHSTDFSCNTETIFLLRLEAHCGTSTWPFFFFFFQFCTLHALRSQKFKMLKSGKCRANSYPRSTSLFVNCNEFHGMPMNLGAAYSELQLPILD